MAEAKKQKKPAGHGPAPVGPLVVTDRGHPVRSGWWYTLASWLAWKAAEEYMGRVFTFVPVTNPDGSKKLVAHPYLDWAEKGVVGELWAYRAPAELTGVTV